MKKVLGIMIGLLISAGVWAQNSGELVVPLTDPSKRGKLKAQLNNGSIVVKGTSRKDVLVKYKAVQENQDDDHDYEDDDHKKDKEKDKQTNKAGLKRIAGGTMDLEAAENQNQVKVTSGSWSNRMDLEIEVPSGFDLTVSTYNGGDVFVSNIQGELELKNYNGEITAENVSGSVLATTYNGEVKVIFDKVTENTPMSFTTWNGDIDITLPAATKATLKMKTEQGEVLSDFDMKILQSGPVQKKDTKAGVTKIVIDEWVKGEINGGGPEFTMKNYNGDVIVRKK